MYIAFQYCTRSLIGSFVQLMKLTDLTGITVVNAKLIPAPIGTAPRKRQVVYVYAFAV